ncbi:transcriptional corepressor SEUSS-like [Impatiens glandulifera]|uniref:transcriptional corepressor SEUSS-like n=1 Tax=Impatiens glandulifera TaxID=253017 RepID=UPI001FB16F51|nr:transcriptional corepressor SEUSS-like [Impatiens glandulifera]
MVPSGPPAPVGGPQSVPPSLLRSNSGLMGSQGGSQAAFPSLVSSRSLFNNVNLMGNVSNVSSLLQQSFANAVPDSGISGLESSQRGIMDTEAETDPLSSVGNGVGFNPGSTGQIQGHQFSNPSGNHIMPDQPQAQQPDLQTFQHNQPQIQQQQQYQQIRRGLGVQGPLKLESQVINDQQAQLPQQLHTVRTLGPVKLEPQQVQAMRGFSSVKMEPQHSDQPLFLHQQQQQQLLHMSRQSPQVNVAAAQILHQQRLLQMQQQQQQLAIKGITMQRPPIQPPQFQPQNMPLRSQSKPSYEPGMCAKRLTHFMYQQQRKPEDNNIEFWRKFVAEYYTPNAKKKWCVSMYGSGRQTNGVFPQDIWHCEICKRKPGRGFEATAEVLPRLFKIKYESGTLEELLYVDMPQEYQNSSGQIVLEYAKAVQESVFEQLHVVRDGQLRIVFSPELKICSWEFCARRHEELIPRKLLIPQVSQLGAAAQKYQVAAQNAASNLSVPELQSNCNMFVTSARQLAKALEVPLVNDLGYTKRYVRCLQISEVVNSMKDLIDYSRETQIGPIECLAKFPRKSSSTSTSVGLHSHSQAQNKEEELQQTQQQQPVSKNANNGTSIIQVASNGSSSSSTIAGLLHHNSTTKHQNPISNSNGSIPYGANAGSANISNQSPAVSGDSIMNESQSSVEKIFHDMMMSSQIGNNGGGNNNSLMPKGSGRGGGIRGRVGAMSMTRDQSQQQAFGDQIFNGIGSLNGFGNHQFDWKSS